MEKCVKLVSNGVVSGKWPEARRWLELTATAPHQATPKGSIAGESKVRLVVGYITTSITVFYFS